MSPCHRGSVKKKSDEQQPPLTVSEMAAMGGKARAKRLSKQARSASAKKAAEARWKKKPPTK